MSSSQGYSLEQLLAWSLEDSLIDGYERLGDRLVIMHGRRRREIPFKEARRYLVGMFRQHPGSIRGGQACGRCTYGPTAQAKLLVGDRPVT